MLRSVRRFADRIPGSWRAAGLVLLVLVVASLAGRQAVLRYAYPFPYREEIITYADRNGLDPLFVAAIIRTESGFRPGAVSPKGAVGLMQIMPDTGRWVAENLGFAHFDPHMLKDPATNLMIGTWYLAELREEFGSNVVLVVAAYNAGRGRVKEWVEKDGYDLRAGADSTISPWPGAEVTEDYPVSKLALAETRDYVRRVIASLKTYRRLYGPVLESSH
jgi:soluble lytic murein transglycosylase